MKTEWDYTELADAYMKRPDYALEAIDRMVEIAGLKKGDMVCDVGAGDGHLTRLLADRGLAVRAVEPNDAMRVNGIKMTQKYENVKWSEGVGEHTGMPESTFKMVSFGSSFNVTDRQQSLKEAKRILVDGGWFACMWNHRDLDDPIQHSIEEIIKSYVPEYSYGTRREDQTDVINASGLYGDVVKFEGHVTHMVPVDDVIEGWRSHGTVHRQAKEKFDAIMNDIEKYLRGLGEGKIAVPYTTHVWMAQLKSASIEQNQTGGV